MTNTEVKIIYIKSDKFALVSLGWHKLVYDNG